MWSKPAIFQGHLYTLKVSGLGSSSNITPTTFIHIWLKDVNQETLPDWWKAVRGTAGSTEWAVAGEPSVVAQGQAGGPRGWLKVIRSFLGCFGGTAVLSQPVYTWEWGGKSCYKELTPDGEEEQHPSIHPSQRLELGTQAHPNFCRRNHMLWAVQHNCKCKTIAEKVLSTIVLNYPKQTNLSQFRPIYGLSFPRIRVEGHWLKRCSGRECREALLRDALCVPFW